MTNEAAPGFSRVAALVVAGSMFMEQLDTTILVTAVPAIARDFAVASTAVTIAVVAYLVTAATFIPLGGWLTGRFGARRIFLTAIAVFTLASLGCALSPDLAVLTAFRVVQGFGGAMMVPVGRLVILRGARASDLIRAVAFITWPALLAPVVAPLVGGILTTYADWRWIFAINVPLGVAAFIVALRVIHDTSESRSRLDTAGLTLCTVAVFGLVAGIELTSSGAASVLVGGGVIVAALVVGAVAVSHLLGVERPLFDLRVFRIPTFRAANSGGFAYRLSVATAPFLIPLLLQDAFGYSAVTSGLMVMAIFIGNVGIKPFTTPLLRALPFRAVLLLASSCAVLAYLVFGFLTAATPLPVVFAVLLLSGVFRSIGFTAYNTMQFADVPAVGLPSANTLSATVQELAGAVGVAIAATTIRALQLSGGGSATSVVPYRGAFVVMGLFAGVAVVSAILLPRGSADAVRARAERG